MISKQGVTFSEMSTKSQRIEMMERTLQETKESLEKIQETTSINLKQALGSFEEERRMMTKKIEVQNQEMSQKELQLFQVRQELEQTSTAKDRKISELEHLATDKEKETHKYKETVEQLTQKLQQLADDNLDKENKMGKELALSNQKVNLNVTLERVLHEENK